MDEKIYIVIQIRERLAALEAKFAAYHINNDYRPHVNGEMLRFIKFINIFYRRL